MEFLCSFTPASNDRSILKCTSTPQKAPREETAEFHLALLRTHARVATNPGESAAIANYRVTFPQDRDLYIPPTSPHGLSRTLLHFHRAEPCGAPLEAARSLGRAPAGAAAHPCPARFGRSGARSALPRPAPPRPGKTAARRPHLLLYVPGVLLHELGEADVVGAEAAEPVQDARLAGVQERQFLGHLRGMTAMRAGAGAGAGRPCPAVPAGRRACSR